MKAGVTTLPCGRDVFLVGTNNEIKFHIHTDNDDDCVIGGYTGNNWFIAKKEKIFVAGAPWEMLYYSIDGVGWMLKSKELLGDEKEKGGGEV